MSKPIYVKHSEQLPAGEHWAILEYLSITIPGDLRSQTNPGHGYPEHSEESVSYTAYTDKAEFEAELKRRLTSPYGVKVSGIHVSGVYSTRTEIVIEGPK